MLSCRAGNRWIIVQRSVLREMNMVKKEVVLKRNFSLMLLLLALISGGCQTVQNRISQNYEYFSSLPPEHQELIRQGKIKIKLTDKEVYLSWGGPSHKVITESSRGQAEKWIYTRITSDTRYRHFRRYNYRTDRWIYEDEPYYIRREVIVKDVVFIKGLVDSWTLYPYDILYYR